MDNKYLLKSTLIDTEIMTIRFSKRLLVVEFLEEKKLTDK
jgi:hypothetical protein